LARDATGTFHLQSGSPAINTATGSYPAVTVDMDGQTRNSPLDVGADEVSTAPVIAQILSPSMVGYDGNDPSACLPVVASADDGNVASNVLDNNLSTRWSANGDGQWIQFCLGSSSTVSGVQIAFYNGNTRSSKFDILTGTDGQNWTTAASGLQSSGTSTNLETFTFSSRTAKYVRIVGHGNSVNTWNSYTEVKIQTASSAAALSSTETSTARQALAAYPNPFTASNTITFYLDKEGDARLTVHDITGQLVAVLIDGHLQAGNHRTTFGPHHLAPGVYLLQLVHNGKVITKKLVKE